MATLAAMKNDEDSELLVLPADHIINDVELFSSTVLIGRELAAAGRIITFGIVPDRPH